MSSAATKRKKDAPSKRERELCEAIRDAADDVTKATAMQAKSNDLHVRVTYATDCPEWWRIQVRRRLGQSGLATRSQCIAWLRRYGESEDDNLALEFSRWQKAAAQGEEVE